MYVSNNLLLTTRIHVIPYLHNLCSCVFKWGMVKLSNYEGAKYNDRSCRQ